MTLTSQIDNCIRLAIRKSPFAPVLRKLLKRKPYEKALGMGRRFGWTTAAEWLLYGEGRYLLEDERFHKLFRENINTDIENEFLLTALRKVLLLSETDSLSSPYITRLVATLIIQTHYNEFVWYRSEEEITKINNLVAAINSDNELAPVYAKYSVLLLMFARLGQTKGLSFERHHLVLESLSDMPAEFERLTQAYFNEYAEEQELKKSVKQFGTISNQTSKEIARNYEEYLYPRWLTWEFPQTDSRIKSLSNHFKPDELDFTNGKFQVLVAGCGTGSKAIEYAIGYGERAKITAVDLSRASLAYATRMAKKYGVNNIEFIQMDLLDLPKLDITFDIVECTGVLHHMKDPVEGGLAIIERVKDNGLVHISLYSEPARKSIVRFRKKYDLESDVSNDDIRNMRLKMMLNDAGIIDEGLSLRWDFFDLNRCKDLLFHPLEHRYTVPQIESFLDALNIEFKGFEKPPIIRSQCWTRYPAKKDRMDIKKWHGFELRHPDAFGGLYEIWAMKSK